jgi:hypothetical protein
MADSYPKPILPYLEGKHGALRIMRFWSHVDIGDPKDCWGWQASLHTSGYGRFKIASYTTMMANRVSLVIHTGEDPLDRFALHHCDNRRCVNPHHLYWGTHSDNMQDKVRRGRCNPADQSGVNNGAAKLTEHQLALIVARFREGLNNKQIARDLPVSHSLVSRIRVGRSWAEQTAALGWEPQESKLPHKRTA